MTKICHYCDAKLWSTETSSLCCQVNLPSLQTLPEPLHKLFVGDTAESRCFRHNIRNYNSAFAFASLGVIEDMLPAGVYLFRVNGTAIELVIYNQMQMEKDLNLHNCSRALSEITEKCPLLSNQWSFFNSVNDMIFLISLRIFPEIMKCVILHNECLDDFKDGGPP